MKEESTFKIVLDIIKRRLNIRTLFILALLLASSSYAWFIYSTKVSSGITAQVKAWNVMFQVGEEEVTQNINFDVDTIYPGMTNYSQTITVSNRGDTAATFSYEINSASVLGETFTKSDTMTSSQIQNTLATNYPFTITIGTSTTDLEPNSQATFSLGVVWPYESGDDVRDTYWGDLAYTFKNNHPTEPCITISLTITAIQYNA